MPLTDAEKQRNYRYRQREKNQKALDALSRIVEIERRVHELEQMRPTVLRIDGEIELIWKKLT